MTFSDENRHLARARVADGAPAVPQNVFRRGLERHLLAQDLGTLGYSSAD